MRTGSGKGTEMTRKVVALDIETTGLDSATDEIISIGAVKSTNGEEIERFYRIIQPDKVISPKITDLTGLSQQKVEQEGISLEAALTDLRDFIGRSIVVGYNVAFDWGFIERGYDKVGQDRLGNRIIDLLKVVRQKEVFLIPTGCFEPRIHLRICSTFQVMILKWQGLHRKHWRS